VTVKRLAAWVPADVEENLRGGILTEDITVLPREFGEIRDALAQPRWYKVRSLGVAILSTLTLHHSDKRYQRQPRFSGCTDVVPDTV
jgi:hypothetical protein